MHERQRVARVHLRQRTVVRLYVWRTQAWVESGVHAGAAVRSPAASDHLQTGCRGARSTSLRVHHHRRHQLAGIDTRRVSLATFTLFPLITSPPVAEWLACWTQAQKGLGSNRSRNAVG